jgi:hypothetical protein
MRRNKRRPTANRRISERNKERANVFENEEEIKKVR